MLAGPILGLASRPRLSTEGFLCGNGVRSGSDEAWGGKMGSYELSLPNARIVYSEQTDTGRQERE